MAPPDPLSDVAFLARSPHRVQVLQTLGDGPRRRPDLHDETGIPQPTLGRILGDFEDRNWVQRDAREYALTAVGELVAEEFDELLETVETVQRLGDVARLLPTDELGFGAERLRSATITRPASGDALRHVRRAEERIAGARELRILTDTMIPGALETLRDQVVATPESDLLVESVITGDAIEQALTHPALADWIRDLLGSERTPVYRYDGTSPMTVALADGTAMLGPTDEQGVPAVLIESDDEVVRAWVGAQLDAYREQSTALTLDDLPP